MNWFEDHILVEITQGRVKALSISGDDIPNRRQVQQLLSALKMNDVLPAENKIETIIVKTSSIEVVDSLFTVFDQIILSNPSFFIGKKILCYARDMGKPTLDHFEKKVQKLIQAKYLGIEIIIAGQSTEGSTRESFPDHKYSPDKVTPFRPMGASALAFEPWCQCGKPAVHAISCGHAHYCATCFMQFAGQECSVCLSSKPKRKVVAFLDL